MSETKKALVISGGGEKGPYAVGVIKHMVKIGLDFEILGGVSVGCLITAMLAQHSKIEDGYQDLEDLFLSVKTEDVHRSWLPKWLGKWLGYFWALIRKKPSIRRTQPLRDLIKKHLVAQKIRESGKDWFCGAVNLTDGSYRVFDSNDDVELPAAIEASASYPVFFEPVDVGDGLYSDGGLRKVTPIGEAIARGATEIYVVILSGEKTSHMAKEKPTVLDVGLRSLDLQTSEIVAKDLHVAQLYNAAILLSDQLQNKGVSEEDIQKLLNAMRLPVDIRNKRYIRFYVFRPEYGLPTTTLEFVPEEAKVIHRMGEDMAKTILGG